MGTLIMHLKMDLKEQKRRRCHGHMTSLPLLPLQ
ncbi:hypothetical protein FWK35_00028500 [Aphis craccivora]|uniref:Uncharacterized protein n=1 Tax=Aphis craccivora TaxID=307492 RepID=A0A6G0YCZ0_APHCR|nr:hypothetical protein FWK35_00028500 [Aphis craccivora]